LDGHKNPEPLGTLRARKPMTQEELAEAIGDISVVTIRKIETGRCRGLRPRTMRTVASFFDRYPCDITEFRPFLALEDGAHCEDGD
jgi:DNA-binding XRE family transcriptional regulator